MKDIKNLVIVCDYAYIEGGATSVAIQTALSMIDTIENVYYFSAVGPVCDELNRSKVNVICLNQNDINTEPNRVRAAVTGIWNRNSYREFQRLLNGLELENTIIHVHSWTKALSASVLSCALKMNFRVVLTLHDYFTVCPNGGLYNYKTKMSCDLKPMSLRCILCNCDKRNYLQKVWRTLRQVVIKHTLEGNNEIDYVYISKFSYDIIKNFLKGNYHFVRNPYDLANGDLFDAAKGTDYVYLGRVSEEKGVDLFCKALSDLIHENRIRGRAIVIGDGELKSDLEKTFPDICFVGWKEHKDIPEYIKNARALVFPSRWYETAGLTPIEFMSYGIPCIISDGCAARDYIKNEVNGLVFMNGDISSLKNNILKMETELASFMSKELINKFNRNVFSRESYLKCVIDMYNKL